MVWGIEGSEGCWLSTQGTELLQPGELSAIDPAHALALLVDPAGGDAVLGIELSDGSKLDLNLERWQERCLVEVNSRLSVPVRELEPA